MIQEKFKVLRHGRYLQRPIPGYTKRVTWGRVGSSFKTEELARAWAEKYEGVVVRWSREVPSGAITIEMLNETSPR